jgi:hypothetical protein
LDDLRRRRVSASIIGSIIKPAGSGVIASRTLKSSNE